MNLVVDRRTRLAKFFDRADFVGLGTMLLLALGIVAVGAGWVNGDAARLVVIALGAVLVGIIAMAVMGNGEVRRKLAPYGLLKPGILWLALFFLAPVWSLFVMSLSAKESRFDFWPDFSWHWDNYRTALTEFRPQFVRSFSYAGIATLLTLIIGFPLAYVIAFRGGRYKTILLGLVVVPFFIADGLHSYQDIPVLLGIMEETGAALSEGGSFGNNPHALHGRQLFYSNAIGTEPLLAAVILDRAVSHDSPEWATSTSRRPRKTWPRKTSRRGCAA
jgi:hypothetical protein